MPDPAAVKRRIPARRAGGLLLRVEIGEEIQIGEEVFVSHVSSASKDRRGIVIRAPADARIKRRRHGREVPVNAERDE